MKHINVFRILRQYNQPPSGGCVLKLCTSLSERAAMRQPPSGGCVLKLLRQGRTQGSLSQPPSGGCVLKHRDNKNRQRIEKPAAFGRLCVETLSLCGGIHAKHPAAFGRLCVETSMLLSASLRLLPAAFGRLCVETVSTTPRVNLPTASRLRAAVC